MEVILIQSTTASLLLAAVCNTEPSDLLPEMCSSLGTTLVIRLKKVMTFIVAVASVASPQAAIITTGGFNRRELLFTVLELHALEPGRVG